MVLVPDRTHSLSMRLSYESSSQVSIALSSSPFSKYTPARLLRAGTNLSSASRAFEKHAYRGGMNMNSIDIMGLPTISVGMVAASGNGYEVLSAIDTDKPAYRKIILKGDRIVGAVFVGDIDRAGIITGLIREGIRVSSFRDLLLSEDFGVISLPANYRKHVVSGLGMEV